MDRFIGQPNLPKFAGKTYIEFASQESKQRIRQKSKLPVSGGPAHRHALCPVSALTLCWQIVLWHAPWWKIVSHFSYILWEWQLSELSCINNKTSISHILCISGIFLWIFTLSTVLLQRATWTSMKTSKRKQRTVILCSIWSRQMQTAYSGYESDPARAMRLYHNCWRVSGDFQVC